MFVLNRLPNLFARRPEMTRLLPAKFGPIEGVMGHARPSGSFVCHFVFFDILEHVERMLLLIFWLGVSLGGSPINMKVMKSARIQFLLCKRSPQSFSTNLVDLWEVQGVPVEEM